MPWRDLLFCSANTSQLKMGMKELTVPGKRKALTWVSKSLHGDNSLWLMFLYNWTWVGEVLQSFVIKEIKYIIWSFYGLEF